LALGSSASAVKKEPKRRKSVSNGDAPAPKKSKKKKPSGEDGIGGSSHPKKAKKPKKSISAGGNGGGGDDDDIRVVTYDQKEELAQKITELPEDRLEGALKIIAEDKPHSANDDEEIELDIDDLSPRTLYRLYRYVVRPKDKKTTNSNPAKSSSDGRKRGTGGKKRKNLDEDEESERIRKLQAQLQQFEGGTGGELMLRDFVLRVGADDHLSLQVPLVTMTLSLRRARATKKTVTSPAVTTRCRFRAAAITELDLLGALLWLTRNHITTGRSTCNAVFCVGLEYRM
jgi:Bromodomain extra-terminal - transcription regulation